jgi:hypothetical protein
MYRLNPAASAVDRWPRRDEHAPEEPRQGHDSSGPHRAGQRRRTTAACHRESGGSHRLRKPPAPRQRSARRHRRRYGSGPRPSFPATTGARACRIAASTGGCFSMNAITRGPGPARALRHERARLRRPTLTTPIHEKRSCARHRQDDSFIARAATRSRLLIQALSSGARPVVRLLPCLFRSVSFATPTSLLCARKALTAAPAAFKFAACG